MSPSHRIRQPFLLLCATTAVLAICLLVYSQTDAFAWDEGFHILTAQLIKNGKRPYLDFFFPQTPLNAYWNAFWMSLFGDTWHTAHAVAALCTTVASLLTGDYILRRFPVREWRFAGALAALLGTGLNVVVFEYGTVAQAYGLSLLLETAAFRTAIAAVAQTNLLYCFAVGLLASAAAASTLLTAVVSPVMLLWILVYNRAGKRLPKFLAFSVGAAIPFLPVLWFYVQKPSEVFFTVFQYNYRYREVGWDGTATAHNIDVFSAWLANFQASLLGTLALAGIFFIIRRSGWIKAQRAEFYLCAWLAVIMGAHISTAHPTFQRYYLLIVPYLAILSVSGIYWLTSRLGNATRPTLAVTAVAGITILGCAKNVYDGRDSFSWSDWEAVAAKVSQVTPQGSPIWADEHVYFLSRRAPPTGMEHENSHKPLDLSTAFTQSLHVLPRPELERRVRAGQYYTTATCDDSERMEKLDLRHVYRHSEDVGDCKVFWDPVKTSLLRRYLPTFSRPSSLPASPPAWLPADVVPVLAGPAEQVGLPAGERVPEALADAVAALDVPEVRDAPPGELAVAVPVGFPDEVAAAAPGAPQAEALDEFRDEAAVAVQGGFPDEVAAAVAGAPEAPAQDEFPVEAAVAAPGGFRDEAAARASALLPVVLVAAAPALPQGELVAAEQASPPAAAAVAAEPVYSQASLGERACSQGREPVAPAVAVKAPA